jgi:hypothetical protein
MYSETNEFGKANSKIDPLGAYINTGDKDKMDPLNFKRGTYEMPAPPAVQDGKEPDTMAVRRRARYNARPRGTILTGPSGLTAGSLNTGGATLLGG